MWDEGVTGFPWPESTQDAWGPRTQGGLSNAGLAPSGWVWPLSPCPGGRLLIHTFLQPFPCWPPACSGALPKQLCAPPNPLRAPSA